MRRKTAWPAVDSCALVALLALGASPSAVAADRNVFIIAAAQGYGVQDCLAEGGECGQVVADAWCEAHGHGPAISFGPVGDEVTGAIPGGRAADPASPYVVRCGD